MPDCGKCGTIPKNTKGGGDGPVKRCFVFAAGTFYGLRERPGEPGDLIIAADAGYQACLREKIVPDLLLGDFDSMEPPADFRRVCRLPAGEGTNTDTLASSGRTGAGWHRFFGIYRR